MSERGSSHAPSSRHAYSRLLRYHIGRHVANLQITNTYEGTFVSEHPQAVYMS